MMHNPKQGFVVLALACCLLSVSGAPAPIVDPVSVAFTAAGKQETQTHIMIDILNTQALIY